MCDDMHACRVQPNKKRLTLVLCFVDELKRVVENLVIYSLHPVRIKRSGVLDLLLTDSSPAYLGCGIIVVRRPAVQHIAWANLILERRRVIGMRWVLHRVQVIEIAKKLVKTVN